MELLADRDPEDARCNVSHVSPGIASADAARHTHFSPGARPWHQKGSHRR
jgi:hypothetical protein